MFNGTYNRPVPNRTLAAIFFFFGMFIFQTVRMGKIRIAMSDKILKKAVDTTIAR
jgi:hypothetical protein